MSRFRDIIRSPVPVLPMCARCGREPDNIVQREDQVRAMVRFDVYCHGEHEVYETTYESLVSAVDIKVRPTVFDTPSAKYQLQEGDREVQRGAGASSAPPSG